MSAVSKSPPTTKAHQPERSRRQVLFLPCYRDERMLDGICRLAAEANWILDTHYYHTGLLPDFWEGDGIICMLHAPRKNPKLTDFIRSHTHCAVVDLSCNDPSVELPRVLQDNRGIGTAGAEHLASLGCRHLGFVMQGSNHFHTERYEGFKQVAAKLGLGLSLHHAPKTLKAGTQDASWLLRRLPVGEMGTLGVMVAADYLSRWVVQACEIADLSIPNDLALIGVDNSREFCELGPISLSSIGNNALQHGYQAAKLLQSLLEGEPPPQEPLLVPRGALHPRQSTDIIAARHPHVAAAMRQIADHFTDPDLTSALITSSIPMSNRRLHDAFVRHIGRTIHEEIVERRVQHALRMIKQSDRKLADIAHASGFHSPETMSRLFQRNLGHPPSYFRNPG